MLDDMEKLLEAKPIDTPLRANRRPGVLRAEKSRVITRPHIPWPESRLKTLIGQVLGLSEVQVIRTLDEVIREFSDRHRSFRQNLEKNFRRIEHHVPDPQALTAERKLLLGAYITSEYSVEAAAFFNPSLIPHPCQDGLNAGSIRFIMSFRATGEGHVSSIEFRSGVIDANKNIFFDPISNYIDTPEIHTNPSFRTRVFHDKLIEMGACNEVTTHLIGQLGIRFSLETLKERVAALDDILDFDPDHRRHAVEIAMWLAESNYEMKFPEDHGLSERVIFPVSGNESAGIEDARFVRFTDDQDGFRYYATYTAYNGHTILPQLLATEDFTTFKAMTLNGNAVQNKGMALFPRKIAGRYAMMSRQDGVNNHIMFSDDIRVWESSEVVQVPTQPWEFFQIGNGGSPLELDAGWLLLTHGVGPMRKYCLGVQLLDLDDPTRVLGRLEEPILVPNGEDREGYVPNVVYSCGAMIHQDELIIPYAAADQRSSIATVPVPEILDRMKRLAT